LNRDILGLIDKSKIPDHCIFHLSNPHSVASLYRALNLMFGGVIKFRDFQMKYAELQNCVLCLTGEIIAPTPKPGKITKKKLNLAPSTNPDQPVYRK